jgi:pyruvate dehydrogenase E2 component (dihydrolipoamide acetyltransferase)
LVQDIWVLRAPRLNANDDAVTLTRWIRPDRSTVAAGDPIAEIETEKATMELVAESDGLLVHAVTAGTTLPVNGALAYVGPDLAAIENARRTAAQASTSATLRHAAATAKARALAEAHDVDLAQVTASGATIKERDVERFLAQRGLGKTNAAANDPRLISAGKASPHRLRVARDLREAARSGIFTTLSYTLDLRGAERMISSAFSRGEALSLLGVILWALGKTLPSFPDLVSVLQGGEIYRYRDVDIAFVVRSSGGELHAPVARHVDRMSVEQIARACARLAKSAMRGKLDAKDVGGACFTASLIPTPNVESFVALPLQTAVLALAATRQHIELTAAGAIARPVATATITYDHALCDGVYVAEFCDALNRALNPEQA